MFCFLGAHIFGKIFEQYITIRREDKLRNMLAAKFNQKISLKRIEALQKIETTDKT